MGVDMRAVGDVGATFHLNWLGMQRALEVMVDAGICNDQWRAPKDGFCRRDCYDDATERSCDRCESFKTTRGKDGLIPPFKFGSNDGWFIAPDECEQIAEGLYGLLDCRKEPDWIVAFADFNRKCRSLGGYRVW